MVFILQFFANTACDTSGYGEGKNLVGSTTVTTDSNGECNFTATLSVPMAHGQSLTATATDSSGNTSEFSLCLDITGNIKPVADAGPDQTVEQTSVSGAEVTLDGTGSSDPDNDTLTYTWTGPFGTATGPTPAVTMPPGINTVYLVVNDGTVDSAPDTVTITVQDTTAPVVSNTATNPKPGCRKYGVYHYCADR